MSAAPIHAFDPDRRTNAQLLRDCDRLGYLPRPILDLTYGRGAMWLHLEPPEWRNDLDPDKGDTHRDFTEPDQWPEAASVETVVFDPPYRCGGTPTTPAFDAAYGLTGVMSPSYVEALYRAGVTTAVRLARRFVLVKAQDHVSSGRLQPLTHWAIEAAQDAGRARLVDSLHVVAGRAQPHGTRQVRARHAYSTMLVFEVTS